jgi:hypothetical protein
MAKIRGQAPERRSREDSGSDPGGRVAVVVVHGIADQLPGQTVREVARLLCHGAEGAPRYVHGEVREVLIPVAKLEPGAGPMREATPEAKALKRKAPRRRPGTPSGFYQLHRAPETRRDLGIALIDYLLGRHEPGEADALYESSRVSLTRRADGRPVDLFEMYWADLSRLGQGGLRALSSLYQLFFHVNTLAADVVDQVSLSANGGAGWRLLQRLHAWMAWLMKGPAALLQLAMLLMVGFGTAALVSPDLREQLLAAAGGSAAIALAALAALAWLRGAPGAARWVKALALIAAAVASLWAAVYALVDPYPVQLMYFGAGVIGVVLLGSYLVERYSGVAQGVRVLGHLIVLASAVPLAVRGWNLTAQVSTVPEWMITAALNVAEWQLALLLVVWALFVALEVAALMLGFALGRGRDAAQRASLHTSRLALVGSSSLFVVLSLVLWSVVGFAAGRAVPRDILYTPLLLGRGYRSVEIFLEDLLKSLGAFFTPLVALFGLLAAAALLVALPSFVEEISPTRNVDAGGVRAGAVERARRLGAWLGRGIRFLGIVSRPLVPLGAIAGGLLYLAFVLRQFVFTTDEWRGVFAWLAGTLDLFQGEALVAAGKWLAGGAVTIGALGSRFTNTFGRLRVAIDAVLDIDNYFADPPDRQPPRARIYSRYASVLAYLRDAGYERIVIVSHSQGTVISADLLRYLHVQGRLQALLGALPVALVTVGSPLRDLYAERFPLLYRFVSPRETGFARAGPAAADLGAVEWVNACRSGDYVGRFIWTPDGDPARFGIATLAADGRVQAERAGDRTEFCLGAGAHTHYFSHDAAALAAEIDRLVAGAGDRQAGKIGA